MMTDITDAIIRHVENRRAAPPPYVDLAAPEVVLHLRVRLKIGTDDIAIEDDDAPLRITSLEGRLAQYGQEIGRINEALQARLDRAEQLITEMAKRASEQIVRQASTEGKVTGHEYRLNVYRDRLECLEHEAAIRNTAAKEGSNE